MDEYIEAIEMQGSVAARGRGNQNYDFSGSRRRLDMAAEQELAKFLDRYLYEPLLSEGGFTSITRVVDVEMQKKGVDVSVSTAERTVGIDEKAQL